VFQLNVSDIIIWEKGNKIKMSPNFGMLLSRFCIQLYKQ